MVVNCFQVLLRKTFTLQTWGFSASSNQKGWDRKPRLGSEICDDVLFTWAWGSRKCCVTWPLKLPWSGPAEPLEVDCLGSYWWFGVLKRVPKQQTVHIGDLTWWVSPLPEFPPKQAPHASAEAWLFFFYYISSRKFKCKLSFLHLLPSWPIILSLKHLVSNVWALSACLWALSSAKQHLRICCWLRQTAGGHFSEDNKQNENPNTRLRAIISPSAKW